ncbi:hypothetical protein [Tunturibacter empetritectus]|uniref:Sugar phosphate isomerase/epimerase n=2 Tax=Tunturiibacter empetritectus TaxID=3069691 RepID=A0A7W8IEY2_9BACT|nr:hypothetical protein [Edaphobacter lichenicola]MBB5315964.1 hypothetical protein [Edaphobacter lichenicola]
MKLSRRQFNQGIGALAAIAACSRRSFGFAENGLRLGLNTWSLRALSQEEAIPIIIQAMKQTRLHDCQILFTHVEPVKFNPVFPAGIFSPPKSSPTPQQLEEQKATAAALTKWRLSVPMSYFEDIRSTFEKQGLRIKSYSVRMGSSEAEIDRLFLMAKALGADSLVTRLPATLTTMTAAAADKHRMIVGLQFSDLNELKQQLAASQYFRMDPDIGDLTKAKIDALQFVQTNYASMYAFDLKDAMPGGPSVPFGEGAAHMKEVLQFLKQKQAPITAYVDCDYAGTGRSPEEVEKCVSYARDIIG